MHWHERKLLLHRCLTCYPQSSLLPGWPRVGLLLCADSEAIFCCRCKILGLELSSYHSDPGRSSCHPSRGLLFAQAGAFKLPKGLFLSPLRRCVVACREKYQVNAKSCDVGVVGQGGSASSSWVLACVVGLNKSGCTPSPGGRTCGKKGEGHLWPCNGTFESEGVVVAVAPPKPRETRWQAFTCPLTRRR
jgi:hypothetical protein